jgi:hypothetical protein
MQALVEADEVLPQCRLFLPTLVPVAAQAAAFVAIFLFLRSKKQRVYRPRTYLHTLYDA